MGARPWFLIPQVVLAGAFMLVSRGGSLGSAGASRRRGRFANRPIAVKLREKGVTTGTGSGRVEVSKPPVPPEEVPT